MTTDTTLQSTIHLGDGLVTRRLGFGAMRLTSDDGSSPGGRAAALALVRLREEGKIRLIGLSEVSTGQLAAARRLTPIASVQNRYRLTDRAHEDVLAACEAAGTAFLPWLPVANGGHGRRTGVLAEVGAELGATPAQVALAWLLHRSPVTVPIPGTTSAAHLSENVAAAALRLSPDQLARLDVARSVGG